MDNAKEYIDKRIVLNKLTDLAASTKDSAVYQVCLHMAQWLMDIPAADVVKVTCCKDCQHSNAYLTWQGKEYYHCTANDGVNVAEPAHFCGYGERKERE